MIYRRVLKYYRGFLGRSLIALAFSFAAIGLNLLKPWPFKIIVDQILPGRLKVFQFAIPPSFGGAIKTPVLDSVQAIGLLCLAMVIIQLLWSLLSFASNYMFVKIGLESLFRLRTEALRSFAAPLAQISRHAPID
jgi:ATP-binding cassette subfamily B protein/subfamily B ATP-binding cassette protein MsbA